LGLVLIPFGNANMETVQMLPFRKNESIFRIALELFIEIIEASK
jgi:hypothetical protein